MKKNAMIPLIDEENKSLKQQICYIYKKEFGTDDDNKKYHKFRDHCHYTGKYRGAAHSIFNLRYKAPKEITVVFHNGSAYHFIIKELAKEFEGQFECREICYFSVPIKKELDNGKTTTCKLKFTNNFRFTLTLLSKLVDSLSEIYGKKMQR